MGPLPIGLNGYWDDPPVMFSLEVPTCSNMAHDFCPRGITPVLDITSRLLMEEILHQLRLVVYLMIYKVLFIPGGCLGFLNHQQYGKHVWEYQGLL